MRHALVVEDDETFRHTVCELLTALGFQVREAENGLIAKTIFELNPDLFDLILSDIRMPAMDGIALLKFVRLTNQTCKFVVMTGFSEIIETKEAYELGANEFLAKPFRLEAFRTVIKNCFSPKPPVTDPVEEVPSLCQIPVEEFITSSRLVVDLYVHLGGTKYVKIANKNDVIPIERLKSYQKKKVDYFFVRPEDLRTMVGLNLKIKDGLAAESKVTKEARVRLLKNTAKLITQNFYYNPVEKSSVSAAAQVIDNTLRVVAEDQVLTSLLDFLQVDGGQLYGHSVGVAMYSIMIARKMGLSSQGVQVRLAMGGLLHDIGKKELPPTLLAKSRVEMTAHDCQEYESHCQRGKEILSSVPGLPDDVVQIAAHHHENNVGTGFPYRLRSERIHPLAKIVSVADCFLQTMQRECVQSKSDVTEAFRKMVKTHEMEFDIIIIKALSELLNLSVELPKAASKEGAYDAAKAAILRERVRQ